MTYKATLPLKIVLPRKTKKDKVCWLSINNYHNWYPFERNQIKQTFEPIAFDLWDFKAERIKLSYHIERETKRRFDTMNYACLVDKFFLDWLVNNNLLVDDDFSRVIYGSIDGSNGFKESCCRVEIEVFNYFTES